MRKLRPYSRIALSKLDGRTREAKLVRETRNELLEHCGETVNAVTRTLIEQALQLTLRIRLMDEQFAATGVQTDHDSRTYLAWSNSLVRLLCELGIKSRQPKKAPPTIQDIMRQPNTGIDA